ncbi:hypothetical protein CYMTET_34635, partial [Cymbomonas tetramitiformis]
MEHLLGNGVQYTLSGKLAFSQGNIPVILGTTAADKVEFPLHSGRVLALVASKQKDVVATSEVGVNPSAKVWNASTGAVVTNIKLNHPATHLTFSADGSYLFAVCSDKKHTVFAYQWSKSAPQVKRASVPIPLCPTANLGLLLFYGEDRPRPSVATWKCGKNEVYACEYDGFGHSLVLGGDAGLLTWLRFWPEREAPHMRFECQD